MVFYFHSIKYIIFFKSFGTFFFIFLTWKAINILKHIFAVFNYFLEKENLQKFEILKNSTLENHSIYRKTGAVFLINRLAKSRSTRNDILINLPRGCEGWRVDLFSCDGYL